MRTLRAIAKAIRLIAMFWLGLVFCSAAAASHLVTGNGFGFAVVAPETGTMTKFYPHPHSFVRADPVNPLAEGIETPNYVKSLGWSAARHSGDAEYLDDSHVIKIRRSGASAYFFMPFGLRRPALIICRDGASRSGWWVEWNRPLVSERGLDALGIHGRLLRFKGIDEPLLLIPLESVGRVSAHQALAGSRAWALISLDKETEAEAAIADFVRWRADLAPRALVQREIARFDRWRVKPSLHFQSKGERHLWRQSETMLRIAQSREPNRDDHHGNGLIVAALPNVYSTPWVRDMAWATVALAKMGHKSEARAALLAYFNAQPTGKMRASVNGTDYQISVVRYFGNGEEEPFFTMEGATNIEFDDWGEALWALGEYLRKYDDASLLQAETPRGPLYEVARDFIVRPLVANMHEYGGGLIVDADTSIWEEHQKDKKHFAFSTAMAIVGLDEFADMARRVGDEAARSDALAHVALLRKGFDAAFIRGGTLHGTLEPGEKNDIDGALIPIINFGLVSDPEVIRSTVKRMRLLKVASGGYRRVRSNYTDPKIFEYWYERQEFLFVDLALAELYRRLGRLGEADAILARIVNKAAADHDVIPEMYVALPCKLFPGKVGDPTGAKPMVGYGAGAYVLHLLDREREAHAHVRRLGAHFMHEPLSVTGTTELRRSSLR